MLASYIFSKGEDEQTQIETEADRVQRAVVVESSDEEEERDPG